MTILTFYFAQVFILAASINYQVQNCHKQVSNALPFCHLKHVHTISILKTLIWSLSRCGQQILYTAAKIKHNEQWTALRTGSLTKTTPNTFIIVVMFSVCDCFSLIIKNQNELKLLGEQKQFKRKRILSHNNLQLQYYDAVIHTRLTNVVEVCHKVASTGAEHVNIWQHSLMLETDFLHGWSNLMLEDQSPAHLKEARV